MGTLSEVTFPALAALKANGAAGHEQGAVQGALFGAASVASGLGPLAFAAVFAAFGGSHPRPWAPVLPQAPFLLALALTAAAMAVVLGLPAGGPLARAGGAGGVQGAGEGRRGSGAARLWGRVRANSTAG